VVIDAGDLGMGLLLASALRSAENAVLNDMVVDTFRVETVLKFVPKHG
jgi:hypothetical protein